MSWNALTLERTTNGGLYLQLVNRLRERITSGELKPGDRLPSERDLASSLGVSRTTIVNAYRELEAQGLVRGYVGRGTFVCALEESDSGEDVFAWHGKVALGALRSSDTNLRSLVRNTTDSSLISFSTGVTALDCFPTARYAELTNRLLSERPIDALSLAPTEGHSSLRIAIANREGTNPSRVMIVAGAQQALDLSTRLLVDPGDSVIMERPGYIGAIPVFRAAGANVVGWDSVVGGTDELEDLILRFRPRFVYVTPSFRNPTGQTWSERFRRDVLEVVRRYRLPVIEDDPYRDLWFKTAPPPPLAKLSNGYGIINIGSFAKTLSGALRLGWINAEEAVINHLSMIKQRSDVCSPSLSQMAVAALIRSGDYDRHLLRLRPELERRHDVMLRAIEQEWAPGIARFQRVAGGIFLWGSFAGGLETRAVQAEANRLGVTFVSGEAFYPEVNGRGEFRLCYSGQPPAAIIEGIRRLGKAIGVETGRDRTSLPGEPLV